MSLNTELVLLVILAIALTWIVQRGLLSGALALALAGLAASLLPRLPGFEPAPETLLMWFAPALIFGWSLQLDLGGEPRKSLVPAGMLGVVGYAVATGVAGLLGWLVMGPLLGLSARWTLLLAAILLVIDAPLILQTLHSLSIARRLQSLMRLESLFATVAAFLVFSLLASLLGAAGPALTVRFDPAVAKGEALMRRAGAQIEANVPEVRRVRNDPSANALQVAFATTSVSSQQRRAVIERVAAAGVPHAAFLVERRPAPSSAFWIARELALKGIAGLAIGLLLGFALRWLAQHLEERRSEPLIGLALAYAAYAAAQALQSSGVVAVVAAAWSWRYTRRKDAQNGLPRAAAAELTAFWQIVGQGLTMLAAALVGVQVGIANFVSALPVALLFWLVISSCRFLVVQAVALMLSPLSERLERGFATFLSWSGLRGPVPLLLALALPGDIPEAARIVALTFGVVFWSAVCQGLTLPALGRRLGLLAEEAPEAEMERLRGRIVSSVHARVQLDRLRAEHAVSARSYDLLGRAYDHKIAVLERNLAALFEEQPALPQQELTHILREMLRAELSSLEHFYARGDLAEAVFQRLHQQVKVRLARLDEEVDSLGPERSPHAEHRTGGA